MDKGPNSMVASIVILHGSVDVVISIRVLVIASSLPHNFLHHQGVGMLRRSQRLHAYGSVATQGVRGIVSPRMGQARCHHPGSAAWKNDAEQAGFRASGLVTHLDLSNGLVARVVMWTELQALCVHLHHIGGQALGVPASTTCLN